MCNVMSGNKNKSVPHKVSNIIGQRLKYEMKSRGVSSAELAKKTDVKTSFIYDVISGKSTNPSTLKLARVADGLGITLASLVDPKPSSSNLKGQNAKLDAKLSGDDYIAIPYLSVDELKVNAIPQTLATVNEPFCVMSSWVDSHLRIPAANLRVLVISGDSMEPTLCRDDVVLVDTANKNPTQSGIFVLFDGYGLVVKRVERIMNAASPRVRILSDNPQYSIYEKLPSEAGIVGRVVWFSRSI